MSTSSDLRVPLEVRRFQNVETLPDYLRIQARTKPRLAWARAGRVADRWRRQPLAMRVAIIAMVATVVGSMATVASLVVSHLLLCQSAAGDAPSSGQLVLDRPAA